MSEAARYRARINRGGALVDDTRPRHDIQPRGGSDRWPIRNEADNGNRQLVSVKACLPPIGSAVLARPATSRSEQCSPIGH
jgi:hypothetical protein